MPQNRRKERVFGVKKPVFYKISVKKVIYTPKIFGF
jgi:hypothetical protein